MMRFVAFLLSGAVFAGAWDVSPARAFDHAAVARQALVGHIRPGYKRLAEAANKLDRVMQRFCRGRAKPGRQALDAAFRGMVLAWAGVEHIRFGPGAEGNRNDRLTFWPDPRNVGRRQVARALYAKEPSVTATNTLARKSVGLQGLPALEYLLYGKGAEETGAGSAAGRHRCQFAMAITGNLDNIATELYSAWGAEHGYSLTFLTAGPGNETFQKPVEVTNALFQAYLAGLATVRDHKIDRPLGGASGNPRPKRAQFRRSGLARDVVVANIEAARDLYLNSGFSAAVKRAKPDVDARVRREFEDAIGLLKGLSQPFTEAVADGEGRKTLILATIPISQARAKAAVEIARLADIPLGFNARDGD